MARHLRIAFNVQIWGATAPIGGQMGSSNKIIVSFIVPTLNRGVYVRRSVLSCLSSGLAYPLIEVEVVVVDSESDDGSWEDLIERFGSNPRVKLVQNRRGVGPTQSWLDGAKLATGGLVTFVWSDDFISGRFLQSLIPCISSKGELAVGRGQVRDIDCNDSFAVSPGKVIFDRETYLLGKFPTQEDDVPRFVSPICALFKRSSFDEWRSITETWCRATTLREQIMWKRAIGPDLLLYLVAVVRSESICAIEETVAQFSSHRGSISISSPAWLMRTGYWLARNWLLIDSGHRFSARAFVKMAVSNWIEGLLIFLAIPKDVSDANNNAETKCEILYENQHTWRALRARCSVWNIALEIVRGTAILTFRMSVSVSLRIYRKVRRIMSRLVRSFHLLSGANT